MPAQSFQQLQRYLQSQVIGQDNLVIQLLIALLADGHILVEGPPGLAKTRAVKSLADCLKAAFIACSLRQIFCLLTSQVLIFTALKPVSFSLSQDQYFIH